MDADKAVRRLAERIAKAIWSVEVGGAFVGDMGASWGRMVERELAPVRELIEAAYRDPDATRRVRAALAKLDVEGEERQS